MSHCKTKTSVTKVANLFIHGNDKTKNIANNEKCSGKCAHCTRKQAS